jgi:hypothetical protein
VGAQTVYEYGEEKKGDRISKHGIKTFFTCLRNTLFSSVAFEFSIQRQCFFASRMKYDSLCTPPPVSTACVDHELADRLQIVATKRADLPSAQKEFQERSASELSSQ